MVRSENDNNKCQLQCFSECFIIFLNYLSLLWLTGITWSNGSERRGMSNSIKQLPYLSVTWIITSITNNGVVSLPERDSRGSGAERSRRSSWTTRTARSVRPTRPPRVAGRYGPSWPTWTRRKICTCALYCTNNLFVMVFCNRVMYNLVVGRGLSLYIAVKCNVRQSHSADMQRASSGYVSF